MSEVEMRCKGRRVENILMKIIKRQCKGMEGREKTGRDRCVVLTREQAWMDVTGLWEENGRE